MRARGISTAGRESIITKPPTPKRSEEMVAEHAKMLAQAISEDE